MAGASEGADVGDLDAGGIGILRERLGDLPSASPWLPRQPWKRNTLMAGLWILLLGVMVALARPLPPHPQIAPAVEHLTQGARPILAIYTDVILWTLAGQFAAIIGWYRSHSTLDFQGRYRVWAWAAVVLTAWGFFAGTSLHTAIAAVAGPQLRWPLWRAEIVVWLIPAAFAGMSVWWLADKDMQRSRVSMWLVRSAILVLMAAGLGELCARDLYAATWFPMVLSAGHLLGAGLLVTGLWCQAWFVAYMSADPPEAREPINWRGHVGALCGTMLSWFTKLGGLWPFRRRTAAEVAKPKRRTVKKKEDEEDGDEEAPKRRRKPAAKTKRVTKPRTRVKAEPEEEDVDDSGYEDEETAEEAWEEVDDSTAESEDEWSEEYEEEEPAPPPARTPTRSVPAATSSYNPPPAASKSTPAPPAKNLVPPKTQPVQYDSSDDDENEDDDANYRVDSGEGGTDMFKGLSKCQRRDLKKQMKDKERQR